LSEINVLPLAVDMDRFRPSDRGDVRKRLGLDDRPVILSLGRVIPLRDRLALVEALPKLVGHYPDLAIVVVGEVYDERFLERARALGVSDHLVLTGPVPYDKVPDYVAAADVEAHDLQGYGLGTASLEVMASGVPVVSVVHPDNFPGLELRNWEDNVIVPPDDPDALAGAVVRLLQDRELASRVGSGQRRFIEEHFSLESTIEQHEGFYHSLLSGGTRAPR